MAYQNDLYLGESTRNNQNNKFANNKKVSFCLSP